MILQKSDTMKIDTAWPNTVIEINTLFCYAPPMK